MFIWPNRKMLQALAGWSMTRKGDASLEQQSALHSFERGCHDLSEVIEQMPEPVAVRDSLQPARPVHQKRVAVLPPEVASLQGVVGRDGSCNHRFSIHTQCCIGCGKSYRQVKGHKPELF